LTTKEISIFSNSCHFEWRVGLSDTILKGDHPRTILAKPLSKLFVTPPFSINFRCQIENQVSDYRLMGASSFKNTTVTSLELGGLGVGLTFDGNNFNFLCICVSWTLCKLVDRCHLIGREQYCTNYQHLIRYGKCCLNQ
jgi:hypothetical protein